MVFDTETTSIDKPFCYNIGYVIADTEGNTYAKRDFVVEQIWHNLPLFNSAYYSDKRPIYIDRMRKRSVIMEKFGYICRQMSRDIKQFNVQRAFAYNSPFDERVFEFNCDWFKVINPFESVAILDIRAFACKYLVNDDYKDFCEKNSYFTDSTNYSTTAEIMSRYLHQDTEIIEEHTALADSVLEYEILNKVITNAELDIYSMEQPVTPKSIERVIEKELTITTSTKEQFKFNYHKIRINKDKTQIVLK